MENEELPIDEDTQIYCDIGRHGWASLIFIYKGEVKVSRVSGVLTDLPMEILKICRAVIENFQVRVALCDEPGGSILELKPDQKQKHTVILSMYEVKDPVVGFDTTHEGHLAFSIRLKRQRLMEMLVAELWKPHMHLKQTS